MRLKPGTLSVEPCLAESWAFQGERQALDVPSAPRRDGSTTAGNSTPPPSCIPSAKGWQARMATYRPFGQVLPLHRRRARRRATGAWSSSSPGPMRRFLLSLVDLRAAIVAPGSMDGPEFKPVGTGPFMVSEWMKGKPLLLQRNPSYWDGPARIDRVVFKSERTATARLGADQERQRPGRHDPLGRRVWGTGGPGRHRHPFPALAQHRLPGLQRLPSALQPAARPQGLRPPAEQAGPGPARFPEPRPARRPVPAAADAGFDHRRGRLRIQPAKGAALAAAKPAGARASPAACIIRRDSSASRRSPGPSWPRPGWSRITVRTGQAALRAVFQGGAERRARPVPDVLGVHRRPGRFPEPDVHAGPRHAARCWR